MPPGQHRVGLFRRAAPRADLALDRFDHHRLIAGALVVSATVLAPQMIVAESVLSYLGVGIAPPTPTWGRMLFEARGTMEIAPEGAIFVGGVVSLTVLAFNFLGDGLRDLLDPRGVRAG